MGIIIWLSILVPSAIIGIICACFIKGRLGIILAVALPWFGLLGVLLYYDYLVPYHSGGASMWPIAQLFAGTISAGTGIGAYYLCRIYIEKNKKTPNNSIHLTLWEPF